VKTTREQRQQNAENIQKNRQERRERLSALREQRRKQKDQLYNQRLQQQSNRVVRHQKDPFGLDAWSNALGFGHHGFFSHHRGGLLGGHQFGLGSGIHGLHGSHGTHGGHGDYIDALSVDIIMTVMSINCDILFLKQFVLRAFRKIVADTDNV